MTPCLNPAPEITEGTATQPFSLSYFNALQSNLESKQGSHVTDFFFLLKGLKIINSPLNRGNGFDWFVATSAMVMSAEDHSERRIRPFLGAGTAG